MIIVNGKVYQNGKLIETDILLDGKYIKKLGKFPEHWSKRFSINAKGLLVLPGMVDPHVHLRDPGDTHKEDVKSGTRAALAGGFTTIMDMPNNVKPIITKKRYLEKEAILKRALCDVIQHFGASENNFDEVKKVNPKSLKIYLGRTTGPLLLTDEEAILTHMKKFPKDKPIVFHAEDEQYMQWVGDRGPNATCIAVEKIVSWAKKTKRKVHLAHASTSEEIALIKQWKKSTVEVAPHYLFLSEKDFDKLGFRKTVNPPLRSEERRQELWKHLNQVDCIASDHAPHLLGEKREGAAGFPGLETSFHLMFTAYMDGLISLKWLIERMSENPVKIFNLGKKGKIAPGYYADLIFVNPKKNWKVDGSELQSKAEWSPFEGYKMNGKVVGALHKGLLKYWKGDFSSRGLL